MNRPVARCLCLLLPALGPWISAGCVSTPERPLVFAHRGASAYAPENTLEAYRLAVEQGADYLEFDLQVTADGQLICLHDVTLERTTNVEEVFPERYREVQLPQGTVRSWPASDFTLDEIRRLDAGSWFSAEFQGAQVPLFREVIEAVAGSVGIFPELKYPEHYRDLGLDMEKLVVDELRQTGLLQPGRTPPVALHSSSLDCLRRLRREFGVRLPLALIVARGNRQLADPGELEKLVGIVDQLAVRKNLIVQDPTLVGRAHALALQVFPYTFSVDNLEPRFSGLEEEFRYFLDTARVDGLLTNHPDLARAAR